MSLIPSGELKGNTDCIIEGVHHTGINESNSLRGVESIDGAQNSRLTTTVSMSLIPSGELKDHTELLRYAQRLCINESNSLRGVESFKSPVQELPQLVSMSLIPSGELKDMDEHYTSTFTLNLGINESNSLRGVERIRRAPVITCCHTRINESNSLRGVERGS